MRVIDSFGEIPGCFEKGAFCAERWRAYALGVSQELAGLCIEDAAAYDFEEMIRPVLEACCAHWDKAEQAHAAFLRHMKVLEERLAAQGLCVQATVVLYLGLCCGAGWATLLDGEPAVLLGLEKIVELDWCDDASMAALVDHELGHWWHFQHRRSGAFGDQALWQLYSEGMAMMFEQQMAGDRTYFHQDKNGWLAWCEANREALFAEYDRRIGAGESVQDFFGDWCAYLGHSDVGYYLGSVLVWHAAQERSMEQLAELSEAEVFDLLQALSGRA